MSDDHKAALASGRLEGRTVRAYLEALDAHRPKRGRKRTPDSIARRLQAIENQLGNADPLTRLKLTQEQMNLQAEAKQLHDSDDLSELESQFVKVAKQYSQRKGITYSAWRSIGVDAATLRRAGINRGT